MHLQSHGASPRTSEGPHAPTPNLAFLLRQALTAHILDLLHSGFSVVLDFSANTVESRKWMRQLIDQSGAAHQLHLFDLSDAVCLTRLQARNASGTHPFTLSDAQFAQLAQHFSPPQADEGFNILRHCGR